MDFNNKSQKGRKATAEDLGISRRELAFAEASLGIKIMTASTDLLDERDADVLIKPKNKIEPRKPSMYKVIMLDDDRTSMDFVMLMLQKHFDKTPELSFLLMMQVHQEGSAVAGVYTKEIAQAKQDAVLKDARARAFPFRVTLEKD